MLKCKVFNICSGEGNLGFKSPKCWYMRNKALEDLPSLSLLLESVFKNKVRSLYSADQLAHVNQNR